MNDEALAFSERTKTYREAYKALFQEEPVYVAAMAAPFHVETITGSMPLLQNIASSFMAFSGEAHRPDEFAPLSYYQTKNTFDRVCNIYGSSPLLVVYRVGEETLDVCEGVARVELEYDRGERVLKITEIAAWVLWKPEDRENILKALIATALVFAFRESNLTTRLFIEVPWKDTELYLPKLVDAEKSTIEVKMVRPLIALCSNKWDDSDLKSIRITPADALEIPDRVLEFINMGRTETYPHVRKMGMPTEDFKPTLQKHNLFHLTIARNNNFLVFFEGQDKDPVAYIHYADIDQGPTFIKELYVREDARRKGYGSWIIRQLATDSLYRGNGSPFILLDAVNPQENLPFYLSAGFTPCAMGYQYPITDSIKETILKVINT